MLLTIMVIAIIILTAYALATLSNGSLIDPDEKPKRRTKSGMKYEKTNVKKGKK